MTGLQNIIETAYENLPNEKKSKPWSFINHGVDLLENEDDLNCYLSAYGKMHEEKIHSALSTLTNLEEIFGRNYQVIDWGCGQGLATLCLIDYLKEKPKLGNPTKIILIEPSKPAINKADEYVKVSLGNNTKVELVVKALDDIVLSDIKITEPITINFFSNILDIESVSLEKLTTLITSNLKGEQYFICVGPLNTTSTRIDKFAKFLNFTDEQIIGKEKGKLKTTRGTIKLLVFKIKGTELQIIKTIYYPPMTTNNNYLHILQKKLNSIDSKKLSQVDKIMEYYKLIVELEQIKEPAIDQFYGYNYEINEGNEFVVDLESNKFFLSIFKSNIKENFPKDLNISIEIDINSKKYAVLNYTYLFEDIKTINTTSEKVKLKLSDFEINYGVLSNFEKSEDEIDKIEKLIKEQNNLENVINVFKAKLDNNLTFSNTISFALSSKNPALSQIYSELKKINKHNVKDGSLFYDFLLNSSIDNKIGNLTNDDLIQLSVMDDSQKKAVLNAFNNKLTVITGPPGSGKTQVISNILANAVMQNKKILVASKNNQAVNNVKNRFERDNNSGFFLRFGNKTILENTTLPDINKISALKATLLDNSIQLNENQEKFNTIIKLKSENKRKLQQRDLFQSKLPDFEKNIKSLEIKLSTFIEKNSEFEKIRLIHNDKTIQDYIAVIKKKRNHFELKYTGLSKLWIDWFTKKEYAFELISFIDETHVDFKDFFKSIPNQIPSFKNGLKIIYSYNEMLRQLNPILDYYTEFEKIKNELGLKTIELEKVKHFIKTINSKELEILKIINNCEIEIIKQSKILLNNKIENKLFNASQPHINNYKDYLPNNIPWKYEDLSQFENTTKSFLEIFNINCVTSLSAKASLPLYTELFDMVVIDEASQCDIASAIPLILRAKQLVVIGDPLQLKHISALNKFEEEKIKEHLQLSSSVYLKYKEKSLWDYAETFLANAKNNSATVNIDKHYRCHPEIIGYSNEAFYIPKRNLNLEICTNVNQFQITPKGMIWVDIVGNQRAENININDAEVVFCAEKAIEIANNNPDISIGIVTPFRHQVLEIYNKIPNILKPRILVDTVHGFQGDEKDVMIYSLVVTNNSPDSKIYWIDNMVPESVNVAITRARNTIYIVGNKQYIKSKSTLQKPLGKLVDYVEKLSK